MNTQVLVIKLPMPIEGMTHMEIRAYPSRAHNGEITDVWIGVGKPTPTKRVSAGGKSKKLRLTYTTPTQELGLEMFNRYPHMRPLPQPCPFHDGTGWKMPELQVFIQQAITDLLEYAEAKRDEA